VTLIKSISGIRGTVGGTVNDNLTPLDVVRFTSAYAQWLTNTHKGKLTVVTGRDARISGAMIHSLVNQTLVGMGVNVIDLGSVDHTDCCTVRPTTPSARRNRFDRKSQSQTMECPQITE
jgi:phosphomannomutase